MNDRIKELAEQCRETVHTTEWPGEWTTFNEEKFAELIVKETIAEFMQQMWKRGIDHTNDPTFYAAMKSTREMFGIEE